MRIALVTTSYPCSDADPSGHFVRTEARALVARGHEVHVAGPGPGPTGLAGRSDEPVYWPIWHAGALGWPGAATRLRAYPWRAVGLGPFILGAQRAIASLKPDRIVAHWLVPSAIPVSLGTPAPLHAVAHGGDVRLICALGSIVRARLVHSLCSRASNIRFSSQSLLDELCSHVPNVLAQALLSKSYVQPADIHVPELFQQAAELRSNRNARVVATCVGRLIASKRVHLAIEAINELGDGAELHVIGDGPEGRRLKRFDRAGNVHFAGRMNRHDALRWIAASDVLVHPSGCEGAPTVVREARAFGTRVVACECGDVPHWACADRGIWVVPANARALAGSILLAASAQRVQINLG